MRRKQKIFKSILKYFGRFWVNSSKRYCVLRSGVFLGGEVVSKTNEITLLIKKNL